jgi:hypothetical protein
LFEAQRQFFAHAWRLDAAGRLLYAEQCFAGPKKSGKTAIAACICSPPRSYSAAGFLRGMRSPMILSMAQRAR